MDPVMTVTPNLYDEDEEGEKYWRMEFEMEHEYGSFSFYISEPYLYDLESWRDHSAGSWIGGSIRVTETNFEFTAERNGSGEDVSSTNKINKEIVSGPLMHCIDEAVARGYFGEETRLKESGRNIKAAN